MLNFSLKAAVGAMTITLAGRKAATAAVVFRSLATNYQVIRTNDKGQMTNERKALDFNRKVEIESPLFLS